MQYSNKNVQKYICSQIDKSDTSFHPSICNRHASSLTDKKTSLFMHQLYCMGCF